MFKWKNILRICILSILMTGVIFSPNSSSKVNVGRAATDDILSGNVIVLVNQGSASYTDFEEYVQPYLDHFGLPYTVLDIASTEVEASISEYALIIIGHRQLDTGGTAALDATERGYISAAVNAGSGLANFDNDLSIGGTTPRYSYVQDVFGFDYTTPGTGSGVTFNALTSQQVQINLWEDDHQDPDLLTTTIVGDLVPSDNEWTEFLYASRGYPAVFASYNETPPLMHFHGPVPDGEYELIAHLYWANDVSYYWGYEESDPEVYSYDVTSGNSGDFADYNLGTVTVSGGQFDLWVQDADYLSGGFTTNTFYGWAWVRLVPTSSSAEMHYITERHEDSETISTGSMTLSGQNTPVGVTTIATSGGQPFLAVTEYGSGRGVQWGSYDWMSHSVKGPIYGLDDLVWRSFVWAARKPFALQGLPPFLTMRVDDESGPFDWIHVANEFGIKPWAGLFYHNIDATEAADLSALTNAGLATTAIHAKNGGFFYFDHSGTDLPIATMEANYVDGTQWHLDNNIPISKFVLPHYYEFGTNAFQGLSDWGVEFVGTMMDPGYGYYSAPAWIMNGPYRLYESGSASATRPVYYADFMSIPGHPEFDGQFFNCVTEIRDDANYEWYPSSDVAGSIGRGVRQSKRALDSMTLATLFTHDQSVSSISMDNWRAILQGITDDLAPYNPIYVTLDHACQYVRAMYTSDLDDLTYDLIDRSGNATLNGSSDMPTMFHLFYDQGDDIHQLLIDVPVFDLSVVVPFDIPGPLASITVSPPSPTLAQGGSQQFSAQGYDADSIPIPNLNFTWSVVNGGGTINNSGLFTAGLDVGTFADTVQAEYGGISGYATVEVIAPALDHFTFEPVPSPQYVDAPFQITITARDISGNPLYGYTGSANLSDSTSTINPTTSGAFSGGQWTGDVTISTVTNGVTISASDGTPSGTSDPFDVHPEPLFYIITADSYSVPQNIPFTITIDHTGSSTIILVEDNHQDPVLVTTESVDELEDTTDGEWTEFLDTTGRPYPSIMAGVGEDYYGLPVMHFYAGGIPNGLYTLSANLYDTNPIRYFFGYDPANHDAYSVDTMGEATGTQHRWYTLGQVEITDNNFHLYVRDADLLGGTYEIFGWAHLQLTPVFDEAYFECADNDHQDPDVDTTTNHLDLITTDGAWTEYHHEGRPFASVMAGVDEYEGDGLPLMRFHAEGIPNGTYRVYANLYDSNPIRYFYGYDPGSPTAFNVETSGGATGTQHTEHALGEVTITDGTFNLYVQDAELLPGGTYDIFGWAWIRLADYWLTLSSSSPTMLFDGNGNDIFGEAGDDRVWHNSPVDVQAVDSQTGTGVTITATDGQGRWGAAPFDINSPTAVKATGFEADSDGKRVRLSWASTGDVDTVGYNIYRVTSLNGQREKLNSQIILSAHLGGLAGESYQFVDKTTRLGQVYYYWLEIVKLKGSETMGPVSIRSGLLIFMPIIKP